MKVFFPKVAEYLSALVAEPVLLYLYIVYFLILLYYIYNSRIHCIYYI